MNKGQWFNKSLYCIAGGAFLLMMGSCSNTKYLAPGQTLYVGSKVKVEGPKLKSKKKKSIQQELLALTRPKPNSSILGLRIKLFAYNIAGNPKKKRSPRAWFKNKFGEPPVLLSAVNTDKNVQILDNTLENKGYFQVDVTGDTVVKNRRATAVYNVKTNQQYTIANVSFPADSSELAKAIATTAGQSLLKPGSPFNLDVIKAEYSRIDQYAKENGFYYFNPDFLITKTDTTIGNNQVNMYVELEKGTPPEGKKIYSIKDVFIYSQYSLNAPGSDTSKRNATFYKGYYVIDRRNQYKPRLFEQSMQFNPGDNYNRTDHNLTLNRLINLGVFKFVKNRFEDVSTDSARLNTYYYLTPLPKQSLRFEVTGTRSSNSVGSQVTLSWRNRNFFKGGELFTVRAIGEFQVQYQYKGYNSYTTGLEAELNYPRYLIPFFKVNTRSGFVPKTNILVAYEALVRNKLYTLNSFRGNFGYSWKESPQKEHQLNPISINYVQPWKVTEQYLDSIKTNITLQRAIERQFILGSTYNYNYNQLVSNVPANGIYFNGNIDLSGNVAGLLTGANAKSGDSIKLFGNRFSQYVKVESDFRYYRKLGDNSVLANRLIVGIGYPYGNSNDKQLPFVKQFFVGGNNSIRAFRSRALGPGTYPPPPRNDDVKRTFIPEQTGDIKLEFNTEFRRKLFSVVQGALFVDAGNVWLYNEDTNKVGAKFTSKFMNELAVGTGVGIRIDVSILVLRLDLAFPIRKPYLPDGDRWVFDQIRFNDANWRKDNLVFNLAIGYPF
jgi:outer membrane protein insertion porin family